MGLEPGPGEGSHSYKVPALPLCYLTTLRRGEGVRISPKWRYVINEQPLTLRQIDITFNVVEGWGWPINPRLGAKGRFAHSSILNLNVLFVCLSGFTSTTNRNVSSRGGLEVEQWSDNRTLWPLEIRNI